MERLFPASLSETNSRPLALNESLTSPTRGMAGVGGTLFFILSVLGARLLLLHVNGGPRLFCQDPVEGLALAHPFVLLIVNVLVHGCPDEDPRGVSLRVIDQSV